MNVTQHAVNILLMACLTVPVFSQTGVDSAAFESPAVVKSPRFDGVIKTKFETSTESGVMRFNVRNSRIGARGEIGQYLAYRVQVELSNEGTFSPLDLHGILKPTKNISILFGQQNIPFDNHYVITPAEMMFANRAFVGKYFTPGTRDIGAVAQYRFRIGGFPIEGQAGIFNGGRINNPVWSKYPSFACRLIAGRMDGFRSTAKIYRFNNEDRLDLFFWGADVHYAKNGLRVQAELMQRHSYITDLDLTGTYIQSAYTIGLPNAKMFHSLTPAARWDAMGYDAWKSKFDVKRLTVGINLGLSFLYDSVIRLDYEHYFVQKGIEFPDFVVDRDLHVTDNKITVELVVRF